MHSGGIFCCKHCSRLSVGEEQNFLLYYCAQPKTFPFVFLWYFLYPFEVLCATSSSTWCLNFSSLCVDCRLCSLHLFVNAGNSCVLTLHRNNLWISVFLQILQCNYLFVPVQATGNVHSQFYDSLLNISPLVMLL